MFFITWILAVLSLAGVYFNIRRKRICFVIWGFTNFSWMLVDIYKDIPAQAALFFVYCLMSIWGYREWNNRLTGPQLREIILDVFGWETLEQEKYVEAVKKLNEK